jgi:2-hydroxychromene-2-carboxylate isomerase
VGAIAKRLIAQTVTSPTLRALSRSYAATRRRIRGARPTVLYFHQVDDPYSHLAAQVLPAFMERYDVDLVPYLVPPPAQGAAPEAARLADYSRRDAGLLASVHGLSFKAAGAPGRQATEAVAGRLAAVTASPLAFAQLAIELGSALWRGEDIKAAPDDGEAAMQVGGALREMLGHYLGATFYFEGEWYWGIDRLPYLEERLKPFRDKREGPVVRRIEASDAVTPGGGGTIDFFLSFRSPYTYLAAGRVQQLAKNRGATVRLKFVLPMVMRGLPVPRAKRIYIMRDAKREAERLGLPFGRTVDPVGRGVERGLAVLHHAIAQGRGAIFAESFLRGVFAEGVDAESEKGLARLARRAGMTAPQMQAALADPSWRAVAEANRKELFEFGLWGVPSFHMAGCAPHWGQDRLWAVERDLIERSNAVASPAA